MKKADKIKELLNEKNGYVTTSDLIQCGVNKSSIPVYIKSGLIRKVSHGIYIDNYLMEDEYFILQKRYPEAILSYNTALYILDITNRVPYQIEVTIKRNQRIRGEFEVHYCTERYYNIGISEAISPFGNPIKIYNAERCICDILREEEFDLELRNRIIDYYWNSKERNIDLLLEYAKIFHIYEKVNTIVEVMMKW